MLGGNLAAQLKYDYTWIFGTDYDFDIPGVETTIVDFNKNPPTQRNITGIIRLSSGPAYISDPNTGRLLFYTNGCKIIDSTHQVMENGDRINEGEYYNNFCEGSIGYYPLTSSILFLPDLYKNQGYYIIHKTKYPDSITCPDLRYSYLDMGENNGLGKVIIKNELIDSGENFTCGMLTAVKHSNQKDWWIISSRQHENLFHTYLVQNAGIESFDVQEIGVPLWHPGQATFTPDGTRYVAFDDSKGLLCMDFDRNTGQFSNARFSETKIDSIKGGLSVSPNSRFAYIILAKEIYQVDLMEEDLSDGIVKVATAREDIGTWFEQNFGSATLGPDCKVYVAPASGSSALHVIHKPDLKGLDCDVRQQDVKFFYPRSNGYLHSYINYNIDEERYCDPTITMYDATQLPDHLDIKIAPNPSSDYTIVQNASIFSEANINIYDLSGRLIHHTHQALDQKIDVQSLPKGIYIIECVTDDFKRWRTKFVKE